MMSTTPMSEGFKQAALAMTAAIADLRAVRPLERISVHCEAADDELLLAKWLNALIHEMATRRGTIRPPEAKGATYTTLRVARHGDGWIAQTVIDV